MGNNFISGANTGVDTNGDLNLRSPLPLAIIFQLSPSEFAMKINLANRNNINALCAVFVWRQFFKNSGVSNT